MNRNIKNVYIMSNLTSKSNKIYPLIAEKFAKSGFFIMDSYNEYCDLVVSLGGDGSFLKNVYDLNYPNILFVGINTGHLGFFQSVMPSDIDKMIQCILSSNYTVQNIFPLKAVINTKIRQTEIYAINEFVVKGNKNKTVHLNIFIGGRHIEKFSGDGVIISSTVGSTAYNYSASGSIIDPRLNLIQVTPVAPLNTNAYRCFTSGVILPFKSNVEIVPENKYQNTTILLSDSREHTYDALKSIQIKYSKKKIGLLSPGKDDFWKKVKEKFL